jgi:hypothetical protein
VNSPNLEVPLKAFAYDPFNDLDREKQRPRWCVIYGFKLFPYMMHRFFRRKRNAIRFSMSITKDSNLTARIHFLKYAKVVP